MPAVRRIEQAQGLFIGAPGGGWLAQRLIGAAQRESSQPERGVGVERGAERPDRPRGLAACQRDQPVQVERVGVERVVRKQRLHEAQGKAALALVRRVDGTGQPLAG